MFGKGTRRGGHVKIHGQMKGPRRIPKGFSVGVFFLWVFSGSEKKFGHGKAKIFLIQ